MKKVVLAGLVVAVSAGEAPCDIFEAGKTPCVAAHSTVRALYGSFAGSLYQVQRASDKSTMNILTLEAGGYADSAAQDKFCEGTSCIINRIYDQSPQGNHLYVAPGGEAAREQDRAVDATAEKVVVGGHTVYAAHFTGGQGYRLDCTSGIAVGDEPETMYMVTSGRHYNDRCCFDYGNAEIDNNDDGAGTMEAVYFGNAKGGLNHGGDGPGPWIMADMENALWGADKIESHEPPIQHDFVTAMIKGDATVLGPLGDYVQGEDHAGNDIPPCAGSGCTLKSGASHTDCESLCNSTSGCVGYVFAEESCAGMSGPVCWTKGDVGTASRATCRNSRMTTSIQSHWAIKGGDAQAGNLKVYWDGRRTPGWAPMKKQGAIILGIGGDNSNGAVGTFYEGVMTRGYSSDATDDAVQANIVAAGYSAVPNTIFT